MEIPELNEPFPLLSFSNYCCDSATCVKREMLSEEEGKRERAGGAVNSSFWRSSVLLSYSGEEEEKIFLEREGEKR